MNRKQQKNGIEQPYVQASGCSTLLANNAPVLDLPHDYPRPPVLSQKVSLYSFQITDALIEKLRFLAQQQNIALDVLLLSVFHIFLARYSAQEDVYVGFARCDSIELIRGQSSLYTDALSAQLVLIKTNVSGNPSFEDVLDGTHQSVLNAIANRDYSFDTLMQNVIDVDSSRHPICQASFIFQTNSSDRLWSISNEMGDGNTSLVLSSSSYAPFDLTLHIESGKAGVKGHFIYPTALFDAQTIKRMAANFQTLLVGVGSNGQQLIGDLPLLSESERQHVLVDWNNTAVDYPSDQCIHQLFEAQASKTPEAIAIVFDDQTLTYSELNRKANQLAHYLIAQGFTTNSLIGLCVEPSLSMIVGLLGILKAGGAYVPLDPSYPQQRLAYMLSDSGVKILVTQERLVDALPIPQDVQMVCLDQDWADINQWDDTSPVTIVDQTTLAYMIYTSGSTGQPKGVPITHGSLLNLVFWHLRAFEVTPLDRATQIATNAFDASVWEIWPYLAVGAQLYLLRTELLRSPEQLQHQLISLGITISFVPTPVAQMLLSQPWPTSTDLRLLLTGGDRLVQYPSPELPFQLVNNYGPTENTVVTTSGVISAQENSQKYPTIGKPIANTTLYLLDRNQQPVPIGVPGELYISGHGLTSGYYQKPELTSTAFIKNPFRSENVSLANSSRSENSQTQLLQIYRTGDLARYLPDGTLEFLGRSDHQVKIRGFRIETGEIETLLNHHAQVQQSLVVVNDEDSNEKHPETKKLVAYVVPQSSLETTNQSELAELAETQVYAWEEVYKGIYTQDIRITDPLFNSVGWLHSHSNQPIPEDQMRLWANEVMSQVLAHKPERVWEIGCGTGMLLFQIAPHCKAYYGTDLSHVSLNYVRQQMSQQGDRYSNVTLEQRLANNFQGIEENSVDLILLNSIIQHFPSLDYLLAVIEGAIRALKPGGLLFLGDIRSLPLLRAFHTFVQQYQAEASDSQSQLQERIDRDILQETELCIAPDFFVALKDKYPHISHIQIRLQGGEHHHEMNKYRYSVLLHVESEQPSITAPKIINASNFQKADIQQYLNQKQPECVCFSQLVNPRLVRDRHIIELLEKTDISTIANLNQTLETLENADSHFGYISVDQLRQLATDLGYDIEICWSDNQSDGAMDALFVRSELAQDALDHLCNKRIALTPLTQRSVSSENLHRYGNNPLNSQVNQDLIPELKAYLKQRLPDYMIPSTFMLLPEFPLTPNGKIDRRALPVPIFTTLTSANFVAPQTETERQLADIWSDVLNLEHIGIHDNFFDLGGHSLLATKVTSRVRQQFGIEVSVNALFDHTTIHQLADVVTTEQLTQVNDDILEQLLSEVDG